MVPDEVPEIDPSDEDARPDQFIATAKALAELVALFTTLVASGWLVRVNFVDSKDAATGTAQIRLDAGVQDTDAGRAATALRALRLRADFSRLEATYAPQDVTDTARWGFSDDSLVAIAATGEPTS
ncbi:hypothetical protein [Gordonia aichiensis]|uniref:hypothetical protein n=1 Tax=Gordonia aichiensis TaxID=36820 RepID=UPI0012FC2043|nr:hypothetical protein [Gordonia aichiensis]